MGDNTFLNVTQVKTLFGQNTWKKQEIYSYYTIFINFIEQNKLSILLNFYTCTFY